MIAPVQDQPVVGMKLEIGRHIVLNGAFNVIDGFAGADAGPVADAKDMGVDGLGRLAPPHVQNHIGGLAANTGQGLQSGAGIGDFTVVLIDQHLA